METIVTDRNSVRLYTFTSMGALSAAGCRWGLRATPVSRRRKRRKRRRGRRRRSGRKSREVRQTVRGSTQKMQHGDIWPPDRDPMDIVDCLDAQLDHQATNIMLPCLQLHGQIVLAPFRHKPPDCCRGLCRRSPGLLQTRTSAAACLEPAAGLQAAGPLLQFPVM